MKNDEYCSQRTEIFERMRAYHEQSRHAITSCISLWGGSFIIMSIFEKDPINFSPYFPFLMLIPIFFLFSLSFKTYENISYVMIIGMYNMIFHEKSNFDFNDNNAYWEHAQKKFLNYEKSKLRYIIFCMSNIEYPMLALSSIGLFSLFYFVSNSRVHIVAYIITTIISLALAFIISYVTSYKRSFEMRKKYEKIWRQVKFEEDRIKEENCVKS